MTITITELKQELSLQLDALKSEFQGTDLADYCEDIETALNYYLEDNDSGDVFAEWYKETYVDSAEIIYYHTAMNYLMENDCSLQESLGLASEMCLDLDSLNSETLATLLLQDKLGTELYELEGAIDAYFIAKQELEDAQEESEAA